LPRRTRDGFGDGCWLCRDSQSPSHFAQASVSIRSIVRAGNAMVIALAHNRDGLAEIGRGTPDRCAMPRCRCRCRWRRSTRDVIRSLSRGIVSAVDLAASVLDLDCSEGERTEFDRLGRAFWVQSVLDSIVAGPNMWIRAFWTRTPATASGQSSRRRNESRAIRILGSTQRLRLAIVLQPLVGGSDDLRYSRRARCARSV